MQPILLIGTEPYHHRSSGFTLVEILLVLGILAIAINILSPIILPSASSQLKHNTQLLLSAVRETRLYALQHRSTARLAIDTAITGYRIPGHANPPPLVGDVRISITVAEHTLTDHHTGGILFYPDGSSTGGRINLHQADLIQQIDVAWLTGAVSLHAE